MRPHLLLIAALAACFDEGSQPETAPGDGQPAELPKKAKAPAAPPWEARLGQAQAKNFGADGAAALEAALKLLTDKPKEDALWILAESAACPTATPRRPAALPAEIPGGQTGRFALPSELSLPRRTHARWASPSRRRQMRHAAAAMLPAVAAGASLPEDGDDAPTPSEAPKWAQADNERAAKPYAEAAWRSPAGRPALRGEVAARRGSTAEAIESYAAAEDATPSGSPQPRPCGGGASSPPAAEGPPVAALQAGRRRPGVALGAAWQARPWAAEDAAAANLRAVQADEAVAAIEPPMAERGGEPRARACPRPHGPGRGAHGRGRQGGARRWGRTAIPRPRSCRVAGGVGRVAGGAEQGETVAGVLDVPRKAAEGLALASRELDAAAAKLNTAASTRGCRPHGHGRGTHRPERGPTSRAVRSADVSGTARWR